jgi:hypothetical protein
VAAPNWKINFAPLVQQLVAVDESGPGCSSVVHVPFALKHAYSLRRQLFLSDPWQADFACTGGTSDTAAARVNMTMRWCHDIAFPPSALMVILGRTGWDQACCPDRRHIPL